VIIYNNNSDNYVYLDTHCCGMFFHLRRIFQKNSGSCSNTPSTKCPCTKLCAFCGCLRLIPAQELRDKDDIEPVVIIDE